MSLSVPTLVLPPTSIQQETRNMIQNLIAPSRALSIRVVTYLIHIVHDGRMEAPTLSPSLPPQLQTCSILDRGWLRNQQNSENRDPSASALMAKCLQFMGCDDAPFRSRATMQAQCEGQGRILRMANISHVYSKTLQPWSSIYLRISPIFRSCPLEKIHNDRCERPRS